MTRKKKAAWIKQDVIKPSQMPLIFRSKGKAKRRPNGRPTHQYAKRTKP